MPERPAGTEVLEIGAPLALGAVALLCIERRVLQTDLDRGRAWCWAQREPHALIVRDGGGIRVVTVGGAAVSLQALREALPELDGVLAAL